MFATLILLTSTFMVVAGTLNPGEEKIGSTEDGEIVLIERAGTEEFSLLDDMNVDIVDRYNNYVLVEVEKEDIETLEREGLQVNTLPNQSMISVKGNVLDLNDGELNRPFETVEKNEHIASDLEIDSYESGEEGIYLVNMLGPINPEWREAIEDIGANVFNYQPNYAYEVIMTPEQAEEVEDFDFVDWVGIYQPEFKMHSEIDEALDKEMPLNIRLRPGFDASTLNMIEAEADVLGLEDLREDGSRVTVDIESMDDVEDLALENDVYYISPYVEPELHAEMDIQLIGGGLWFMDDEYDRRDDLTPPPREGDPQEPYRKHGDYGAYINQLGYYGEDVTVAVADTGVGDGTIGDAGVEDFTGRVIGGYGFGTDETNWADGHYHGTACTGLVVGDTYSGTGETWDEYEDGDMEYYMGQGLASESEIFATKIFDDGGTFLPAEYYPIVEEPAQRSDAYVHSNSWGASTEGVYSDSDEIFDQTVRDADRDDDENVPMVITTSAGNDGGRGGYEQEIGSPANSKNVITIGGNQPYNPGLGHENPENMYDMSSRGWTEDNRVKPDLIAPSDNVISQNTPLDDGGYVAASGTSFGNPLVAGAATIVVDWYEENHGETPSPAMVKSILINTANDLDPEIGDTSGHIPNRDEGWGVPDISKLESPYYDPIGFELIDQNNLITTGEKEEYQVSPENEDEPLKITLTWTDEHAMAGDSEGGTPTLKNNLDLEVETPSGEIIRGNAFDRTGDGESDDGFTYPDAEVMSDFDHNDDGWDNVNNVQNVYIPPEEVELGSYEVRILGSNIPADANNDGEANQDYALTIQNTFTEIISMNEERYALEDTIELTVIDEEKQEEEFVETHIRSDTNVEGLNVTLEGSSDTIEFTGEVQISESEMNDTLKVSHGDEVKAEYWYESQEVMKTTEAVVDGLPPDPPTNLSIEWRGFQEFDIFYDDASEGDLGYTIEKSHENASDWSIREHGSTEGNKSWDFGDGEYNKTSEYGMRSSLISPEVELIEPADKLELEFDHWRSFHNSVTNMFDGGNLKISTNGTNGPWELIEPEEEYDGEIMGGFDNPLAGEPGWGFEEDWETVTFDLLEFTGETVHFRWDAGVEAYDEGQLEGWRIDNISVLGENTDGTDDNQITWNPSPSEYISQYNIYRAETKEGPWDESTYLDSVPEDVNHYIDLDAGELDEERWWYVVRAEKDVGYEENNEIAIAEPGGPEINITDPVSGEIFTEKNVTIEWDGVDQIEYYEIRLNDNEPINVGSDTQYTFESLSDSHYTVSVFGYVDNETKQEIGFDNVHFVVDTQPPELVVIAPPHDGYTSDTDVTIEWEGKDELSGIDYYEIKLEDEDWIDVGTNNEHTFYDLEHSETYTATIRAWNRAGFNDTVDVSFTVDNVEPDLEIISPVDGEIFAEDIVTVEWTASDEVSGIDYYEIRVDDEDWIFVGDDESYTLTGLDEGKNTIEVLAWDKAGNNHLDDVSIIVDTTEPDLEITAPEDGEIFGEDTLLVEWAGSDEISGIDNYELFLNSDLIYEGESEEYELVELEDGDHEIEVKAIDNAGNTVIENVGFTVDTTPPELEITSPEDEEVLNTHKVIVEWEGTPQGSDIEYYEVRIDDGEWNNVGLNTTHTFVGLDDGDYTVEVRATDVVGNIGEDEVIFSVYREKPTVYTQEATDIDVEKATLNMEFTVGDYDSVEVYFEINGDEVGHADYVDDGSHHYEVTDLDSNTVYQFTAVLEYNGETIHDETLDFKTEPKPDYLEIDPSDSTIDAGQSQEYVAFLYYEDGTSEEVTEETIWSDNIDESVWTDNKVTPESAGDWEITGEYNDFDDTATLYVGPADVDYVIINPDEDQTIETGETIGFSAEAYDQYDNLIIDYVDEFDWENAMNGLFVGEQAGEYLVTASYDGVTSEPTTVTVIKEYFEIEITDYDDEVKEGDTVIVDFTVENTGELEGSQDILFSVDGTEEDSVEVTLNAGEEYSGEFEWEAEDEGDYVLEVASEDTFDSLNVTVEEEVDEWWEVPGFTTVLLIVGTVIAIVIYHKKDPQMREN